MPCSQHRSPRNRKIHFRNAAYYPQAAWKGTPKKKSWSIVVLPSGQYVQYVVRDKVELETIFRGLANNWREATGNYSLNMRRYAHQTYQVLMHALGKEDVKDAITLILRELQQRPDAWFEALKVLTKTNPAIECKTFDEAVKAWLDWGKQKKYIT